MVSPPPNYSDRERVERFLTERCELDPLAFEPSAMLADAYLAWLGPGAGRRERDLLWKNLAVKGFERQTRRFEQPVTFGQIREPRRRMRGFAGLRLRTGAVAESEPESESESESEPEPKPIDRFADYDDPEPAMDRDAQLASLAEFRKAFE